MAKKKNSNNLPDALFTKMASALLIAIIGGISYLSQQVFQEKDKIKEIIPNALISCESNLFESKRPRIDLEKMANEAQELCYEGYAAKASYISKSNLYSAERLTKERVSVKLDRQNPFHAEEKIPADKRAELSDYKNSGFDRGHLAPNADMPTRNSQYESFSLANMIPQVSEHNQKTWSKVEQITRNLAKQYNDIYVVTLPVYQNKDGSFPRSMKAIGANKVYIPQFVAKAIYIPKLQKATVVFSPNDKSNRVETMSLTNFYAISKVDVFPSLGDKVKNNDGQFFKW